MSRTDRPRRPGRPNGRPSGRPASGGSGRSGAPTGPAPVPLETGRARGVVAGLFVFVAGFAAAGIEQIAVGATGPVWYAGVGIGLAGIGLTGAFLNRGTVPRPEGAIFKPDGLRAWLAPCGLPVTASVVVFYALLAVSVVGNIIVPTFFHA